MFWDSIINGLLVLTHWEVYVAVLGYLAATWGPLIAFGLAQERINGGTLLGCLTFLALPAIQSAATFALVLSLSPILLGFSNDAAWSLPWLVLTSDPLAFIKVSGALLIASVIVAFVPIIGRFHALHSLVVGGLALAIACALINTILPGSIPKAVDFIPGFWFIAGLLVAGGIISVIATITAALVTGILSGGRDSNAGVLLFPIGSTLGFIPMFLYAGWLTTQIRGMS